jgi:hypothetical protein
MRCLHSNFTGRVVETSPHEMHEMKVFKDIFNSRSVLQAIEHNFRQYIDLDCRIKSLCSQLNTKINSPEVLQHIPVLVRTALCNSKCTYIRHYWTLSASLDRFDVGGVRRCWNRPSKDHRMYKDD